MRHHLQGELFNDKPCGLCRQMAGDPDVEPVMDSGGEIEDFDSHDSFSARFFG
jgi:hypothetical protein